MKTTETATDPIKNYYIVCSFSGAFALVAVAISAIILITVWRTKPHLHTVRHLLTCNTCVASILFCVVQTNNYTFLIFLPEQTSDIACRWRGYFAYVTLCGVNHSFLIQAISRLFISVFAVKYRRMMTYKIHYVLICIQWLVCVVTPLPAIVTKDIYFVPNALCWVPFERPVHVVYTYVVYYIIPVLSICIIYIFIYYRVRQTLNRAEGEVRSVHKDKRDLELLRNIVILLIIYLMGGVPILLFFLSGARIIYLVSIVTMSLAVAIEKVSTILLDQELRQMVRRILSKTVRVTPSNNEHAKQRNRENLRQMQQVIVQSVSYKLHIPLQTIRMKVSPSMHCDNVRTNE